MKIFRWVFILGVLCVLTTVGPTFSAEAASSDGAYTAVCTNPTIRQNSTTAIPLVCRMTCDAVYVDVPKDGTVQKIAAASDLLSRFHITKGKFNGQGDFATIDMISTPTATFPICTFQGFDFR